MLKNPLHQIKNYLTKSLFYPMSSIKPYRKFEQLGLNNIEFNEVVVQLEHYNQITIPDASLKNVVTIGDLVKLVNLHINS
jgi:acyl carrier protein